MSAAPSAEEWSSPGRTRTVSASLTADVAGPTRLAVQVSVARPEDLHAEEEVELTLDGAALDHVEVPAADGGRLWVADATAGTLDVRYRARVRSHAEPAPASLADQLTYLRPSRYCESDRMSGLAARLFHDLVDPADLLSGVSSWVGRTLEYVSGSSGPTDGAVDTLLAGRGVCRDFAHLVIALLRGLGVPARLAAVYAPGLTPMDFHAVAEACVDGRWYVVDGTLLAPRSSLVRVATGRDAADTSFLSSYGAVVRITDLVVTATVSGALPADDVHSLVSLA